MHILDYRKKPDRFHGYIRQPLCNFKPVNLFNMRIIIETDGGAQPHVQMGAQGAESSEISLGATSTTANAIDAGPPKVGSALQTTGASQPTESSTPQSDTSSGGSAPKELTP